MTTHNYYNINIQGNVIGSNFGSGSVTAQNIAGESITPQNRPVWQAESHFVYANVPTMPTHFVGREVQVGQLVAQLTDGHTLALSTDGLPGVGKTTLAVALAHHGDILRHFSDGILWGGLGKHADPLRILGEWGTALGHDLSHLPTPEGRQRALQNILGNKKVLLVLDDAWQVEPTHLLRCGGPHCAHLLTTRDKKIARAFAGPRQMNNVDSLPLADGLTLLQQIAPEACTTNPEKAAQLVQTVGGLPLAIELLGGYLADPNAPERLYLPAEMAQAFADLTVAAQRLQLASQRLGSNEGVTSLQATIELSLTDLPAETQTAFYNLGAFAPKPATFSWDAARAVSHADNRQLATLIERNLLEADGKQLALHQTLADVAASHNESPTTSKAHADFYLALANQDRNDWQTIELAYEQIQWAWQQLPNDETVLEFVWALRIYQGLRGLALEQITWIERALPVARTQELKKDEAALLNNIGAVYDNLGDPQQALQFYNQALPIFSAVGDRSGEAATLNNIGAVYRALGDPQQALQFYNQALPILVDVGNRVVESITRYNMAVIFRAEGQLAGAVEQLRLVVALDEQTSHPDLESDRTFLAQVEAELAVQG